MNNLSFHINILFDAFHKKERINFIVKEIQLRWSTWSDICELIKPFRNGTQGRYVDNDNVTIGLYYNNNYEDVFLKDGDWIYKHYNGNITYESNKQRKIRLKIDQIVYVQ